MTYIFQIYLEKKEKFIEKNTFTFKYIKPLLSKRKSKKYIKHFIAFGGL